MKAVLPQLKWMLPMSLGLGGLVSFAQGTNWLTGWLSFSLVFLIGSVVLFFAHRWAGGGQRLAWMIILAAGLRLALGAALTLLLPVAGYDNPTQNGGYVFFDAFQRDTQAWDLAKSGQPLWTAFNKTYASDQYGGLLAFSALLYRYLSQDAHRPLLIILVSAIVAAVGIPFLWKAVLRTWGERIAVPTAWIMVLYPESILQGSSQMREPFLITFVAIAFWGLAARQQDNRRESWAWLGAGITGMLLISPGIALVMLVVAVGWIWLGGERRKISLAGFLAASAALTVSALLFIWGISRQVPQGGTLVGAFLNWLKYAVLWDIYLLERSSGWVQELFRQMPSQFQVPFVIGYGFTQPLLPAAVFEPTIPIWRALGVFRAVGWYAFLPLLIFGWIAAFTSSDRDRRWLIWLGMVTWTWIVLAAARGGGDQWDNPRYRVILLALQAIFAGHAWAYWRLKRSAWFVRFLVIEAVFLIMFSLWYISRYYTLIGPMPFWLLVGSVAGLGVIIVLGGLLWDIVLKPFLSDDLTRQR